MWSSICEVGRACAWWGAWRRGVAQVMDSVQTLDGGRRSNYDPDEIEEEQKERDIRNKVSLFDACGQINSILEIFTLSEQQSENYTKLSTCSSYHWNLKKLLTY